MSSNIEVLERDLNNMTGQGKILDALQQFYAEDCTFQEGNGGSRGSKQAQHDTWPTSLRRSRRSTERRCMARRWGKNFHPVNGRSI